jgi:hypothetical protein
MTHAVFGELEFIDCAWEGYSVSSLFGEEKTIDLYVYADENEKIIKEAQEKVYLNYLKYRIEIEEAVRKEQASDMYRVIEEDASLLSERNKQ